jgi:transcriptional regulator with XRE-family HTH domain
MDGPSALNFIGHLLYKRRISRGASQTQISIIAGITQSHLSDIEKDKKIPSLHAFEQICKALGVSMGDVIAEAEFLATRSSFSTGKIDSQS